jgi:O-methyltransferase involved in polyketide biosynthesis
MAEPQSQGELPRFDPNIPNVARMYDYYLGGRDNFAADREAAEQALAIAPELRDGAAESRRFLTRAVRYLVGAGIRQFIDIGCGLPTQGNVHEIAQAVAPDTRVAYADHDPVVVTHAEALLHTTPLTTVLRADARRPEELLADPALGDLIDLDRPVAVLLSAVLHLIPEDDVVLRSVRYLRDRVAPGSYLLISHAVADQRPHVTARLAALYQDKVIAAGARRANVRTRAEVEPLFDGLDLVEPGLVYLSEWRPEPGPRATVTGLPAVAGVGRRP